MTRTALFEITVDNTAIARYFTLADAVMNAEQAVAKYIDKQYDGEAPEFDPEEIPHIKEVEYTTENEISEINDIFASEYHWSIISAYDLSGQMIAQI